MVLVALAVQDILVCHRKKAVANLNILDWNKTKILIYIDLLFGHGLAGCHGSSLRFWLCSKALNRKRWRCNGRGTDRHLLLPNGTHRNTSYQFLSNYPHASSSVHLWNVSPAKVQKSGFSCDAMWFDLPDNKTNTGYQRTHCNSSRNHPASCKGKLKMNQDQTGVH